MQPHLDEDFHYALFLKNGALGNSLRGITIAVQNSMIIKVYVYRSIYTNFLGSFGYQDYKNNSISIKKLTQLYRTQKSTKF